MTNNLETILTNIWDQIDEADLIKDRDRADTIMNDQWFQNLLRA